VSCGGIVSGLRSTSVFVGSVSGGLASSSTVPCGRAVSSLSSCFPVSSDFCSVLLMMPSGIAATCGDLSRITRKGPFETRSDKQGVAFTGFARPGPEGRGWVEIRES
jgi:hypothetical protein